MVARGALEGVLVLLCLHGRCFAQITPPCAGCPPLGPGGSSCPGPMDAADWSGANIQNVYAGNEVECCGTCSANPQCNRWVYDTSKPMVQTCVLKEFEGQQILGSMTVTSGKRISSSPEQPIADQPKSWGGMALAAFGFVFAVYMALGIMWKRYTGERGAESLPNYGFWVALPGLVQDGLGFAALLVRRSTAHERGYRPVETPGRSTEPKLPRSRSAKKSKKSSKDKARASASSGSEGEKKKKGKKAKKRSKASSKAETDNPAAAAQADTLALDPGSAARGSGKTSHMSSGARETGVAVADMDAPTHYYDESGTLKYH